MRALYAKAVGMTNFLFKIQTIIKINRAYSPMPSKSVCCFLSVFFAAKTKNPSHQ
ncbi:conserved hypothetical protein [Neisseria gonorrhoeae 1291]|nr:conserved hypothetical protein [Neisseria gonorrhoeae 1291]EEZ43612.1 conserved hypothetical protein [Neisseria gonorrhoeae 35/02]EEZ50121.1 conserved hypothetical protein [Neisseria gonorrhoeae PID18]EEZ52447.1 conserved hypothetical protein [Neisseria gonorrhoeae PID1]EEZ54799.1 conserved hypothetical protein [Neisseria gonorrhoeae PID332]EEZ57009.1 conserved hypothetical protein [Neisseria gonorrhoeae SK-92-679]EEZ59267.1 conserved hypothetical protein [Neisseria gonorrhoeae SK-93-1035]